MFARLLGIILSLMAIQAYAEDKPLPLGPVKGLLINGITSGDSFVFHDGDRSNCETTTVAAVPDWVSIKCDLKNTYASFTDRFGKIVTVTFDSLVYVTEEATTDNLTTFSYRGKINEAREDVRITSDADLVLQYWESNRSDIYGYFELEKFGHKQPLQASPIQQ